MASVMTNSMLGFAKCAGKFPVRPSGTEDFYWGFRERF